MARTVAVPLPLAGKIAADENFPVASLLLDRAIRPKVVAFYNFARAADDLADSPHLTGVEKLARLDAFEQGLQGLPGTAQASALRSALGADPRLLAHASQLLQAFRRDALVDRCGSWADLMAYCACSAAPVGRFLLDVHDQDPALHPLADSLCAALQVLNHLQDCGADYRALNRVYLPGDWLEAHHCAVDTLTDSCCCDDLRHILDLALDRIDMLIEHAAPLATLLTNRRLAMETAATISVAQRLALLLRRNDPLAGPVKLSPFAYGAAMMNGLRQGFRSFS